MLDEIAAGQLSIISGLGNKPLVLLAVTGLFSLLLYWHKHREAAYITFFSLLSYPFSIFLKFLFKHPRPASHYDIVATPLDYYAFPSSHVVVYVSFWGIIFYYTYKYYKDSVLFVNVVRWLAIYFIIMVGASRIFLNAHYLKDIIAGYIFGTLFLGLLILADKKLSNF